MALALGVACSSAPAPQPAPKVERKLADRLRAAAASIREGAGILPAPGDGSVVPKPRVPLITKEDLRLATVQLAASAPSDARDELRDAHRFLVGWWVKREGPKAPQSEPVLARQDTPPSPDPTFANAQRQAHIGARALGFTNALHLTMYVHGLRGAQVRSFAQSVLSRSDVLYRQLLQTLASRLLGLSESPGPGELRALLERDPRGDTDGDRRLLDALKRVVELRERAGAELYALGRYSGRGQPQGRVCPGVVEAVYGFPTKHGKCQVPLPWTDDDRPLGATATIEAVEESLTSVAESILVVPDPWVVPVFQEPAPAVSLRSRNP